MVEHPAEYPWTSYRNNAQGEYLNLIKHHDQYRHLGLDFQSRMTAYRELFSYELDSGMVDEIRLATNGNFALGSEKFKAEVALCLVGGLCPESQAGQDKDKKNKNRGLSPFFPV